MPHLLEVFLITEVFFIFDNKLATKWLNSLLYKPGFAVSCDEVRLLQSKHLKMMLIVLVIFSALGGYHGRIQRDLEAGIPVWAPKLAAQKSFLVQYVLSSIHKDKEFLNTQGLHRLKKRTIVS